MNKEDVGQFIKNLREEKGMTQEELAKAIYCSRSNLAHIESGRVFPSHDKIVLLSSILGVSEMEIYSGRKLQNPNEVTPSFFEYVKHLKSKTKKYMIVSIFVIVISIVLFLSYYFLSSYNTIKMYKVSGETDNFIVNVGTLLVSKDKIILTFSVDSKNDLEITSMSLNYIKDNNPNFVVSHTSSFIYIVDSYGYNEYFNYDDLQKNKGYFSLDIFSNDIKDTLELNLEQVYDNKKIVIKKTLPIRDDTTTYETPVKEVPPKIAKNFNYKQGIYSYSFKEDDKAVDVYYYKEDGIFMVNEFQETTIKTWQTFLGEKDFHYSLSVDKELIYSDYIKIDNMNYEESKIYDYFKVNYIDKYVGD